jgi:peptidoglycan/xylan/chitin deacetylase (PgdA/CDA1 family)
MLTVDVEFWPHKYYVTWSSSKKFRRDADLICNATTALLDMLKKHNATTTFFVVSEIYDWHPWLIDKISNLGHEIGFHTHTHRRLRNKEVLIDELQKGKKFIQEFDTKGFRAPEVFIKKDYLPILRDWGFTYDSSIYSEHKVFEPVEGILEVPISTYPIIRTGRAVVFPRNLDISLAMREIPFGSGYFVGLLGRNLQWFIKQVNKRNIPANIFVHTWQIVKEPEVPKIIKGNLLRQAKMIPYNINRRAAVDYVFENFNFAPMIKLING